MDECDGKFFETIFDCLPDGIIVFDRNFRVISINDSAESILRISRKKARGKLSKELIPLELEELASKALAEERTFSGDEIVPTFKSGHKIPIQCVASPLYSTAGAVIGVILQMKDVQASTFLSAKNAQHSYARTLEDLFLGLTHELKNPLSGIRGAAQLLLQTGSQAETNFCAQIIIKEVDRLTSLIDTFKELEPFASENLEKVDLNELLSEIEYLESRSTYGKQIEFLHNLDVALPTIWGERNSLKQVFINLIKNAMEAITKKGTVAITTKWISDHKINGKNAICVEIKDTGSGIPKEHINHIFKPFYTTKEGGTGLGLFLAYQIIAKHGGTIMVDSELGSGTTVKVYFPPPE